MLMDRWRTYLNNDQYKLSYSVNAEIEEKVMDLRSFLSGKKQSNDQRCHYYVLHLGLRQSDSYARSISLQCVWLSRIPGWTAKQRYFRRNVNNVVLKTQLNNDQLYEELLTELDKKTSSTKSSPEDDTSTSLSNDQPDTVSDLTAHSPKRQRIGLAATVSPLIQRAMEPFRGKFPFINQKLNRRQDFNLKDPCDQ